MSSPIQLSEKHTMRFAVLGLLLLVVLIMNVALGSEYVPFSELVNILLGSESNETLRLIIMEMRLPKSLTAILAGAALAVAGLLMQALFRNPLADPSLLGINSGASLGVALVMLPLGASGVALLEGYGGNTADIGAVAAAFIGAAFALSIVMILASRVDVMTLLLVGLMFGYTTSALTSILKFISIPERVQVYLKWTYGDFGGVDWDSFTVMAPAVILGIAFTLWSAKILNALLLGEDYAQSVGINVKQVRFRMIAIAAILSGAITAFCGPIGFIGVAVPHLCRGIFQTSDHRILVPACLLVGALVALAADLIAQVPGSRLLLPLNSITALFGAPIIISILIRRKRYQRMFAS